MKYPVESENRRHNVLLARGASRVLPIEARVLSIEISRRPLRTPRRRVKAN